MMLLYFEKAFAVLSCFTTQNFKSLENVRM